MSRTVRTRITYANVMSTLAVFIALGGSAWAVSGRQATSGRSVSAHPRALGARRASASPGQPTSNARIHACVDNRSGLVRIVAVGHHCSGREHALSWVSFDGILESDHKTSSIDITDSGIVLNSTAAGETPQTIKLSPGGVKIDAAGVHLTSEGGMSFSSGRDMTTQVGRDRTTTVDGNDTTTVHRDRTTTVDKNDTTTIHKNRSTTVDQNETETVGINRALTIGAANEETVGGLMAETVGASLTTSTGGSLTTSIGGSENLTINGNSTTRAVGGTLDTTAGTIKNNADVIQNVSDESLVNFAGTTLTNHADGSLTNSAGTNLTNQAANTLTNTAAKNLIDKSGNSLTVRATAQAILTAPTTRLGCGSGTGAARLGDSVTNGQISTASTAVFVC